MKRHILWTLAGMFLLMGFLMMPSSKMQVQAEAKMNYSSVTLKQGTTKKLKVSGTTALVTWSSSNENVVTVNANGRITAVKGGKAVITAKAGKRLFKCKVSVVGFNSTKKLTLSKGDAYTLKVKNGTAVKWSSSDKTIVKVSSKGVVKAKQNGVAVITCKTRTYTLKCRVYVASLSKTSVDLLVGAQYQLSVLKTGSECTWSSSNSSIASVDENGLITAGEVGGSTTITCRTGRAKLTCTVNVKTPNNITTPMSTLPTSSNVSRQEVTVESYPGTRTYMVYNQSGSDNQSSTYSSYMPRHGCAACALTTVLSGYASNFYSGFGPAYTVESIEKNVLGSSWLSNYAKYNGDKDKDSSMPVSLYGITKVLDHYGISNEYVRTFDQVSAIQEITEHLKTGNAVIIEVRKVGSDTTWSNSYHTMVLLGITDTGYAIVADSANRDGFGDTQRIKYATVTSLIPYMFSCTNIASTSAYFSTSSGGGYILVNPQE